MSSLRNLASAVHIIVTLDGAHDDTIMKYVRQPIMANDFCSSLMACVIASAPGRWASMMHTIILLITPSMRLSDHASMEHDTSMNDPQLASLPCDEVIMT